MCESGNLSQVTSFKIPLASLPDNIEQLTSNASIKYLKGNICCNLNHNSNNYITTITGFCYDMYDKDKYKRMIVK